jgi:hypothetical protein
MEAQTILKTYKSDSLKMADELSDSMQFAHLDNFTFSH